MSSDLVYKYKRNGKLAELASKSLSDAEKQNYFQNMKSSIEAMVRSDLENNEGLLSSLVDPQTGGVDKRKVDLLFERRVRSEVEVGLAGRPIDEYIGKHEKDLLNEIRSGLRNLPN